MRLPPPRVVRSKKMSKTSTASATEARTASSWISRRSCRSRGTATSRSRSAVSVATEPLYKHRGGPQRRTSLALDLGGDHVIALHPRLDLHFVAVVDRQGLTVELGLAGQPHGDVDAGGAERHDQVDGRAGGERQRDSGGRQPRGRPVQLQLGELVNLEPGG